MPPASSSASKKILIAAAVLVAAAALYFGWQYAGSDGTPVQPVAETRTETRGGEPEIQPLSPGATAPAQDPNAPASQLMTAEEGDELIDEILRSDKENADVARDLHELVKRLNGEAQVNASQHLVNMTEDENYSLISGFLTDPKMNPDVLEVLFSDLMNRDRTLQLPLFMNILKNPEHPQNEEVRNVLSVLAGEDYENDYAAWDKWAAEELKSLQEE